LVFFFKLSIIYFIALKINWLSRSQQSGLIVFVQSLCFRISCKCNIGLCETNAKRERRTWERLNKRWSEKISKGLKSKRFTSTRYVSHFHAPGNCRSQLIRYPAECFIKAFINPVLFLLTRGWPSLRELSWSLRKSAQRDGRWKITQAGLIAINRRNIAR